MEIILCIFVTNSPNYALKHLFILGIFARIYKGADKATENAPKILVAGIRNKGAAIGKHTDKA